MRATVTLGEARSAQIPAKAKSRMFKRRTWTEFQQGSRSTRRQRQARWPQGDLLLPFGRCSNLPMTLYDNDEMADLSAAEKRALKGLWRANLRGVPRGVGYEGNELWQLRSDRWLERSEPLPRAHVGCGSYAGTSRRAAHSEDQRVQPFTVPPIDADIVRETREALKMSHHVFGFKIGVNPRTLERWEQGRSKPNEQAAALIWLVRKYPDTLKRLESLAASA